MRLPELDPVIVTWICNRAAAVKWTDRHGGMEIPAFTYTQIARNVKRRRGVELTRYQVRRIVERWAPSVFADRRSAWYRSAP